MDLRGTNLNLKDKTDRLSRDFCTKLPFYAAQNPKRAQISYIPRRGPKITHV